MGPPAARVLTVNGGSSSIKFALYAAGGTPELIVGGIMERLGGTDAVLRIRGPEGGWKRTVPLGSIPAGAIDQVVELLLAELGADAHDLAGIGHRVVHGGPWFHQPQVVSSGLITELRQLVAFDPEHLPDEIALLEAFHHRFPRILQLACFDTAFHHQLPEVARTLPLPERLREQGLRRYGFHGLSYAYLMRELRHLAGGAPLPERIILAHLGSGASLAAIQHGKAIDTSMGFSSTGGLMMGTRSGDLDPGVILYLLATGTVQPDQLQQLLNHQSGLLGVSGTSADCRDLEARAGTDPRAAAALELFCYQACKWVGSFAAALGGLDLLVFTGGIGEHAPAIRARILGRLGFLGITLDERANQASLGVISAPGGRTLVRVIPTDEQLMIALALCEHLASAGPGSGEDDDRTAVRTQGAS